MLLRRLNSHADAHRTRLVRREARVKEHLTQSIRLAKKWLSPFLEGADAEGGAVRQEGVEFAASVVQDVEGSLAHKQTPPQRTLRQAYP